MAKITKDAKGLKKSIAEKTKIVELEESNKISITDFLPLIEKIETFIKKF